jgi:hypothetical protein
MCFVELLSICYAYNTIDAYLNDVLNLQMIWNDYCALSAMGVTFGRVRMMMRSIQKRLPVVREKKRLWQPSYFPRIVRGMGWHAADILTKWTSYENQVMWTILILMYQLILRQGEIVEMHVPRHTARRPWVRSSVQFFAGTRKIPMLDSGAPAPEWYPFLTHVRLESVPDKTNVMGSRDPFILLVFDEHTLRRSVELRAEIFDGGRLLWSLFTLWPVPLPFASMTPLFTLAHKPPPRETKAFNQNAFARGMTRLCKRAMPLIEKSLNGRTLGGHCMRGAAAEHAFQMGATIKDVCELARWQAEAFVKHKGYDYLRRNHSGSTRFATAMMANLSMLPGASALACRDTDASPWIVVAIELGTLCWVAVGGLLLGGALVFLLCVKRAATPDRPTRPSPAVPVPRTPPVPFTHASRPRPNPSTEARERSLNLAHSHYQRLREERGTGRAAPPAPAPRARAGRTNPRY